jgi:hypothetical protein
MMQLEIQTFVFTSSFQQRARMGTPMDQTDGEIAESQLEPGITDLLPSASAC